MMSDEIRGRTKDAIIYDVSQNTDPKREYISCDEQLRRWVNGDPVHRLIDKPRFRGDDSECCPDFSCCNPELLQPVEVRQAFAAADEKGRNKWLGVFLGEMLRAHKAELAAIDVYMASKDPKEEA